MANYLIGIDQSTQGTKALLFDEDGALINRKDLPHEQIVNQLGWVEHKPEEIYQNTIAVVKKLIEESGIAKENVAGIGISNQRETALAWDKSGEPVYNAIVWQCARGEAICKKIEAEGYGPIIREHTGLQLSPYFSAAKIAWILEHVEGARKKANDGSLYYGTVDSYLVYRLTGGKSYKTDYSNASRTQLFNINTLTWDKEICDLFHIPIENLAEVVDSDSYFGETDFDGYLESAIPIHGVLGDSHGALFGQGCHTKGMVKATYGTGSSVMMNIGEKPVFSSNGMVTSLAWSMGGNVNYVLEGNINYTGAVISWMEKELGIVTSAAETEELARKANPDDRTYLVPAFSGLGAPYWDSTATGIICGVTRMTGKKEFVKAGIECIAYQIQDVLQAMSEDSGISIQELRVDGGPTKNQFLMNFQSNISNIPVQVPDEEELSGIGAVYAAGIGMGFYKKDSVFGRISRKKYAPSMELELREKKLDGWKKAVKMVLSKEQ